MAESEALAALYRDAILANAAEPVGFEVEIAATHAAQGHNPLCGDEVTIEFQVRAGQVEAAAFHGASCAICTAAASLLCANAPGQGTDAIGRLASSFAAAVKVQDGAACADFLQPMLGVSRYPARVSCALLPLETAKRALESDR